MICMIIGTKLLFGRNICVNVAFAQIKRVGTWVSSQLFYTLASEVSSGVSTYLLAGLP